MCEGPAAAAGPRFIPIPIITRDKQIQTGAQ
jgi:hypothetical protein